MQIDDLKKLPINDDELHFDYDLKKLNWFNIGGKTKVFFKAKSLTGLVNFLKFNYRGSNLSKDLIFLSATFEGKKTEQKKILQTMEQMKNSKDKAQPTKIKTGGSTFKNPIDQTSKKVWELINESVPNSLSFGDAIISEKHMNFFVNKKDASFKDMKKLIYTVQEKVQKKTGININPEIIIVE